VSAGLGRVFTGEFMVSVASGEPEFLPRVHAANYDRSPCILFLWRKRASSFHVGSVTTHSLVGTDRPRTDRDSGKAICWSPSCGSSHSQLFTLLATSAGECRLSTRKSSAPGLSMAMRALHPRACVARFHEEGGGSATAGDGDR
jgi:hypothetical protein